MMKTNTTRSVVDALDGVAQLALQVLPGISALVAVALTLRLVVGAPLEQLLLPAFTRSGGIPRLLL